MAVVTILHLEDSALDAEFVRARLEHAGLSFSIDLVRERKEFVAKLQLRRYDLILCDYQVPTFDGLAALDLAREYQLDTPFIFVSGAMGEESAVEALKRGATDYVLKDRIARLPAAVERALKEASERAERQDAELRATTILENMGESFVMLDDEWRFTFANAAAERALGIERSDILGKVYWEFYPNVASTELGINLRRVMLERITIEFDYNSSASNRWLSIKGFPGPTGSGICVQFRDVTEAKHAEHELRDSEERLRLALKGGRMGTWDLDLKSNQLTSSDTCKANYGRAPEDSFTYEHLASSVHEDDLSSWRKAVETAIANAEDLTIEYRVRWQDRSVHWVHVRASCITGKSNSVERLTGVSIDISERKRNEDELAERELRYRLVADAANDAIWDWNLATNQVVWNEGVRTCFGYAQEQVSPDASWWIDRIHPEDVERISESIHSQIVEGPDLWESDYRFRRSDGGYAFVADRGRIVRSSTGQPMRMVGSMLDLTEKRKTESELRAAEERFNFVRKSSGVGFWYCDLPFDVLEWDDQVKAHFHFALDVKVTIETFYDRIHPDDRDTVRKAIELSIVGRAPYDVDYRTVDPAIGKERWVRAIGRTFYSNDGTPTRFDGVTLDVTERKRADALVADQRRALEEIAKGVSLRSVLETLCRTVETQTGPGATATILLANRASSLDFIAGERCPAGYVSALMGLPFGPAVGSCGTAAFRRDSVIVEDIANDPLWESYRDLALAHGLKACSSSPFFSSDGTVLGTFAIYHPSPQPPSQHELLVLDLMARTAGIAVERDRADAELARHLADEKRHGALLERVAVASRSVNAVLSADSIARIVTEEAKDIIGASVAATTYTTLDGTDQRIDAVASDPQKQRRLDDESSVFEEVVATVRSKNQPLRITQSVKEPARPGQLAVPLVGHSQQNLGVIQLVGKVDGDFSVQDEAVLVQLAAIAAVGLENARLYERLREQDRRKDEFLATLAHELRNPLAPVRNGIALLTMTGINATDTVNVTSMMERQIAHMTRLVDDLLDVSRITRGKVELRKERVDLRAVVTAALEVSHPLIEANKHGLVVLHTDERMPLQADLTRLAQVVSNLLNNAAKYTPEGGRIELSTIRHGSEAIIRVRDNGVGIPREMLPKVFELFTQVGRTLDRSQGGLGIGLALVNRLVEMHGGKVTAESDGINRGSTFVVRLPLANDTALEKLDSRLSRSMTTQTTPLRILVVDDNVDAALTLALILKLSGHLTKTAHNGPDAIVAAQVFNPEIVFLDIGLPGMNGYEVAHRLRTNTALQGVVLIALTGWGTDEDRKRAMESGFDFHLTKPVETDKVKVILSEVGRRQ